MVRRDVAGTKNQGRPALLKTPDRIILEIPAAPEESGIVDGLRQPTTVDGELIKIGGVGDNSALQLQDIDGRVLSGLTASRSLTKELAPLIYEMVRLTGIGQWCRTAEGVWQLDRMLVQGYETLDDDSAMLTLEKLRNLNIEWPHDASERLRNEREADL
jgi:hypothetical protein